jgi:hypothetical protein
VSVFVTDRSAHGGITVVVATPALFAGFGSVVAVLAFAVFVSVPAGVFGSTFTISVATIEAPVGKVGKLHVGAPGLPTGTSAHAPAGPESTEKPTCVVPAGGVSVSNTLWAGSGPLFVTVMV